MDGREVSDCWVIVEMETCNLMIWKQMGECVLWEGYEKSDTVKQCSFQGVDMDKDEGSICCESRRGM